RAALDWGIDHARRHAFVIVGEMRRLEVEIDEVRPRLPVLRTERTIEGGEQMAFVDQQAALRSEVERPLIPQAFCIDEDLGALAHADRLRNPAEILRLTREHSDAIAARLEIAEQRRIALARGELAGEDR